MDELEKALNAVARAVSIWLWGHTTKEEPTLEYIIHLQDYAKANRN